jgi:thiamine kinase-like enzyme
MEDGQAYQDPGAASDADDTLTPDQVIDQIDDWKGKDIRWEKLEGGITNHNYTVWVNGGLGNSGGGKYVLRVPGPGSGSLVNREYERHNAAAAARAGVAPPILYYIEPACTVVPFIEGETLHPDTIAGHPDRLEKIAKVIRTYHDNAIFVNEGNCFDMVRQTAETAKEVGAAQPAEFDHMCAVGDRIEAALKRHPVPPRACHMDLLSENFILDRGGKIWVLDWEYARMLDPYFDLGCFCAEHPLSVDEEKAFFTMYQGEMNEPLYCRMLLYKLEDHIVMAIWSMLQAKISDLDFDFYELGMSRVRKFHRIAADPDFEKWISEV